MKKITHPIYKDYPEHPYISEDRDLDLWIKQPEKFPYSKVERTKMIRLEEGLLPGDIVMLWRIGFGNFTNETHIPDYFEYRYGVYYLDSIELLIEKGYVTLNNASESAHLLSSEVLKRILKSNKQKVSGNKQTLLDRFLTELTPETIEASFDLRRYQITNAGKEILNKYQDIIQKHGPKML